MKRVLDRTLGKWFRHFMFVLLRTYYALFYNVSCSNKHLLQDQPGSLILATHVSRHDGPLIAAVLYTAARVRPTVHYTEYNNKAQWYPLWVGGAIPMSSPKEWGPERRAAHKEKTLGIIRQVMENGNSILLFPAGRIRRQEHEIVEPYLTGARDILAAAPETPVLLLRLDGLGRFQQARHDGFWSFIGRKKGRRHVSMDLTQLVGLDPTQDLTVFNKTLETLLNESRTPVTAVSSAAPASPDS